METDITQLRTQAVPRGVSSATTSLVVSAKNATIIDAEVVQ